MSYTEGGGGATRKQVVAHRTGRHNRGVLARSLYWFPLGCPDIERQSVEEIRFAEAGLLLFEIAGHKRSGGC